MLTISVQKHEEVLKKYYQDFCESNISTAYVDAVLDTFMKDIWGLVSECTSRGPQCAECFISTGSNSAAVAYGLLWAIYNDDIFVCPEVKICDSFATLRSLAPAKAQVIAQGAMRSIQTIVPSAGMQ